MLRWYLNMMLFEEVNGMNYYFPPRWKAYWQFIHIALMSVEICGLCLAAHNSPHCKDTIRMLTFFVLAFLPFFPKGILFVAVIIFELTY